MHIWLQLLGGRFVGKLRVILQAISPLHCVLRYTFSTSVPLYISRWAIIPAIEYPHIP